MLMKLLLHKEFIQGLAMNKYLSSIIPLKILISYHFMFGNLMLKIKQDEIK